MSKTTAEKMYIKPATTVWSVPADRVELIGQLPAEVTEVDSPTEADTALVFAEDEATLRQQLDRHGDDLVTRDNLWVAYPKGNKADLNRDTLWPILMELNLRAVRQIAVDDTWSALKFRPIRPGEVIGGQGRKEDV